MKKLGRGKARETSNLPLLHSFSLKGGPKGSETSEGSRFLRFLAAVQRCDTEKEKKPREESNLKVAKLTKLENSRILSERCSAFALSRGKWLRATKRN